MSAKIVLFLGTAKKKYIFLDEKLYFWYFYQVLGLVSHTYGGSYAIIANAISHERVAFGTFGDGTRF